jgi:hypothetical protein
MIVKIFVCVAAIAIGLYGAWWASSATHFLYVEKAKSFDDLSAVMFVSFVVSAAIFCPMLCWGGLRALKRVKKT